MPQPGTCLLPKALSIKVIRVLHIGSFLNEFCYCVGIKLSRSFSHCLSVLAALAYVPN